MTETPNQSPAPAKATGSLVDLVDPVETVSLRRCLPLDTRIKIAVLGLLVVLLNAWQFRPLVHNWLHDENWNHGFVIPLFSLYLIYRRFDELVLAPRRRCLWGLGLLVAGIAMMIAGVWPVGSLWISRLSMPLVVFAVVLYVAGTKVARLAAVPIFYLALAMPIPKMLYTRLATPLQDIAAQFSCLLLRLAGVKIDIAGIHLNIVGRSGQTHSLFVAEACSGVRSLIAYVALGVAWAYLEVRPIWQRVVLVLAAVPIALFLNVVRVVVTCWMYVIDKPALGQNFMHEFMGIAMLVPAVLLFWGLGALLNALVVVEEEDEAEKNKPAAGEGWS